MTFSMTAVPLGQLRRECGEWRSDLREHRTLNVQLRTLKSQLTGTPGQVLWTRGTHDIHEMPKIGLSAPTFLKAAK